MTDHTPRRPVCLANQLSRFWAAALKYELEPPPAGFATRDDYWRDVGVPEEDLGIGAGHCGRSADGIRPPPLTAR